MIIYIKHFGKLRDAKNKIRNNEIFQELLPVVLNNLGVAYSHIGDPAKAKRFFSEAIKLASTYRAPVVNMGKLGKQSAQGEQSPNDTVTPPRRHADRPPKDREKVMGVSVGGI